MGGILNSPTGMNATALALSSFFFFGLSKYPTEQKIGEG